MAKVKLTVTESACRCGYILMFACNDQTQTVRYITAYAIDSMPEGPYFLQMDR